MPVLLPVPTQQFTSRITGLPVPFGTVYTYAAGTLTPKAAFSDPAGTVPLTNPINLDANGFPISSVGGTAVGIWVDGSYKYIVKDAAGVTVDTKDNVTSFVAGGSNTIDINGMTPNTGPSLDDYIPTYDTSAAANRKVAVSDILNLSTGRILQRVSTFTGGQASGTGVIPADNTIPQITEGDEYMNLSITPLSASSILEIEVIGYFMNSTAILMAMCLFRDATANALKTAIMSDSGNQGNASIIKHYVSSLATTPTTFRVRAGGASGATTFNGQSGIAYYGGTIGSGIIITEYA